MKTLLGRLTKATRQQQEEQRKTYSFHFSFLQESFDLSFQQ
jgi:hypothetical protein